MGWECHWCDGGKALKGFPLGMKTPLLSLSTVHVYSRDFSETLAINESGLSCSSFFLSALYKADMRTSAQLRHIVRLVVSHESGPRKLFKEIYR